MTESKDHHNKNKNKKNNTLKQIISKSFESLQKDFDFAFIADNNDIKLKKDDYNSLESYRLKYQLDDRWRFVNDDNQLYYGDCVEINEVLEWSIEDVAPFIRGKEFSYAFVYESRDGDSGFMIYIFENFLEDINAKISIDSNSDTDDE